MVVYHVLCLAIGVCYGLEFLGGGEVFGRDDVGHRPADALVDVYGRIESARGESAGEDDMAVEDGADGVGEGLVGVVAFHEDGVKAGDAAALIAAGSFEEFGEHGEYGRGVSPGGRGLAYGEPYLSHGGCNAGYGVHDEEDVAATVAEIFGYGGGDEGSLDADEGGLVGRCGHDDGA